MEKVKIFQCTFNLLNTHLNEHLFSYSQLLHFRRVKGEQADHMEEVSHTPYNLKDKLIHSYSHSLCPARSSKANAGRRPAKDYGQIHVDTCHTFHNNDHYIIMALNPVIKFIIRYNNAVQLFVC